MKLRAGLTGALMLIGAVVVLPCISHGQVLFLGQASGERSDNDNYASFTFNIPAGTTLLVVGATDGVSSRAPVSAWVSDSNTTMTHVITGHYNGTTGGHENGSLFYRVNPPTGNQQIRVIWNGDTRCKSLGAVALANVDITNPILASKEFWGSGNNENGATFSGEEAPVGSFIVSSCGSQFTDLWGWFGTIQGQVRGTGHTQVYSRHVTGGLGSYWKHRGMMGRMGPLATAGTDQVRYWAGENWGAAALSVRPHNNQLTVNIAPAWAIAAGGQWSIDGGATWYDSGDSIDVQLPDAGGASYTVIFSELDGINTPAAIPVTVLPGQSPVRTGTYSDTIPPTGSISINDGDVYTNARSAVLTLSASDTGSGMENGQMQFSNDGSTWSSWEPYGTSKDWMLADGDDGLRTVYVQYRDAAGVVTPDPIFDTITLDRLAPTVTVDALLTNNNTPTLTGQVTDTLSGIDTVIIEVNGAFYTAGVDAVFDTWSAQVLTPLPDGVYDVIVTATDNAGNVAVDGTTDELEVDTVRPECIVDTSDYPGGSTEEVPIVFTLLFSKPVSGLTVDDLMVTNAISVSIDEVLDEGATYVVHAWPEVVAPVTCMVPANQAFDAAGNGNEASNMGSVDFVSDNPLCSVAGEVSYTNQTPTTFFIVFNMDVVGLHIDDIEVTNGNKLFMNDVNPRLYLLTVGLENEGPVTCRVPAGVAFDAITGTLPNLASNRVTVIYDVTPPTADVTLAGPTPTTSSVLVFTAAFSEDVGTSFTIGDVVLNGTLAPVASLNSMTKSGNTYTITATVSEPNANGTLGITVGPDVEDLASNMMEEAVSSPLYRVRNWFGFTSQPASRRAYVGDSHTFSVTVSYGAGEPTYQWWKRSADKTEAPVPGAQSASLALPNLAISDQGDYWCVVTYDGEEEVSNEANLEVEAHLQITAHPVGGEVVLGEEFTFTVATTGGYEPVSYQWKKNGAIMFDAPNAEILTLSDVDFSDSAVYSVVVSDAFLDVIESAGAELVVNDFPMPVSGGLGLALIAAALSAAGAAGVARRPKRR